MITGIEMIAEERQRQMNHERWDSNHDDSHVMGELSAAAACYALNKHEVKTRVEVYLPAELNFLVNSGDRGDRQLRKAGWYDAFPWESQWDKRRTHSRLKSLIIAGALIAAEIDRIQRKTVKP